ncbi:MAG: multidrug effflux MFS transporter [Pseudomonadota bacterium]
MAEPPASARGRFLNRFTAPTLFTLIVVSALGPVSMNMFLPSMPAMADGFGVDYAVMQLAVTLYLGVMGLLQLVFGPLSDRFGRRPVLLTAFLVFSLATLGCLSAPNFEVFLVCRLLQAAAAAGLVLSRAMARDMHGPDGAASQIGYITMGMALGPMLSPMAGGMLEQAYGWQATFAAMGAFGLFALALTWGDAGETNRARSASLTDQMKGYPALFGSRRFWGYAAAAAFSSGSFFAFLGGAPWVGSQVLGLEPSQLGFYFGIIACGYMSGNFVSGRYSSRVGLNRMILLGTLVASTSLAASFAVVLSGFVHPLSIFGPVFFVGLGNGMTIPNATAGTLSVRPKLAGSAAGLGSTLMVGGGAGIAAVTGALLRPEWGAKPLVGMMLASSIASVLAVIYVFQVERRRGPLPAADEDTTSGRPRSDAYRRRERAASAADRARSDRNSIAKPR